MALATKAKKRPKVTPPELEQEYLAKQRHLTTIQASAYLSLSRDTIFKLIAAAESDSPPDHPIPFSRLSARVIRFDRLALDKWVADQSTVSQQ